MKPAAVVLLMLVLSPASFAARSHGYAMDVPAAGVRTIAFDVQEGDLIIRGDPTATSVRMHVSIDRYWLFRLGETGILKRLVFEGDGKATRYPAAFKYVNMLEIPLFTRVWLG